MTALYLMGVVCFVIAVLLWAVIRGGKREGEAEAKVEAREQTIAAVQKAAESDQQARERMSHAAAKSVSEPVARIRERLLKRPRDTR